MPRYSKNSLEGNRSIQPFIRIRRDFGELKCPTPKIPQESKLVEIVPVWLHRKRNTNSKLLTYALLGEQSDACFVKEDLLRRLGVNGPEVEVKLSTVLAEKVIKGRRAEGLVVRGYSEDVEIPPAQKLLKILYTSQEEPNSKT